MVTPVAKFKSASSRTKILCLIIIRSNLKSNFTHRDPYLENATLNLRRFAQAKLCRHLKSVVGGGIVKGGLFCFGFASQLQAERNSSPHPFYNKVKNNLRRLFFTQGSQTRNAKF